MRKSGHLNQQAWLQLLGLVLCWLGWLPVIAQGKGLEAIAIQGGYWHHSQLVTGQKLNSIAGLGGDLYLRFGLGRYLAMTFTGAYGDLKIDQDDAIEQWDWAFWQRFYRNYVRDLVQRDPNYQAILTPKQNLLLKSLTASARIRWPLHARLTPFADFGAGLLFYERNLRLHEHWQKYFPELNYTYSYNYDNHAEYRQGKAYTIRTGAGVEVNLTGFLGLEIGGQLQRLLTSDSDKKLPLVSFWQLQAGLVFHY